MTDSDIEAEAKKYNRASTEFYIEVSDCKEAFIRGAQWAREEAAKTVERNTIRQQMTSSTSVRCLAISPGELAKEIRGTRE